MPRSMGRVLIADLIAAMETIAPLHLAEEWDNIGLLLGDASADRRGAAFLTIDLTEAVLDEAREQNAAAIIAYHPPIFSPVKRITAETRSGRVLLDSARLGIAVYSPHTALDAAPGGMTDWLIDQAATPEARDNGGTDRAALRPGIRREPSQSHKLVTFVPRDAVERVRAAMAAAGAGHIGNYDQCSFAMPGAGSFRGNDQSNPSIGTPGKLEFVEEARLDMVVGIAELPRVLTALRAAHPYEEPAVEVYALTPKPDPGIGPGRIVTLEAPTSVEEIAQRLKKRLGASCVMLAAPRTHPNAALKRIAAVPGSGASLLEAAIDAGADCFITGEMKHHEVLAALERNCAVILAGHTETERAFLPELARRLKEMGFDAIVSAEDRPPLRAA